MMSPSPPPPAIAAIVAVAITKTAAIRIPAKISGAASGSSTPVRIWRPVIPMPRADSTTLRSTWSTPKYVFVRTGGIPRTTRARVLSQKKFVETSRKKAIRTRLGSARPAFETLIARNEPRWWWPRITPNGSAIAIAMPSAAPERARWETVLSQSRCGCSAMKRNACGNVSQLNVSASTLRPPPGRHGAPRDRDQRIRRERQQDREPPRGDDLRLEDVLLDPDE